ncbi:hypothetical protein DFH09DRAFT_393723 [Mycena vulgaris]|nr:hypothetical protein DFH09DRAFT_393723 [Mycena vulgaris]
MLGELILISLLTSGRRSTDLLKPPSTHPSSLRPHRILSNTLLAAVLLALVLKGAWAQITISCTPAQHRNGIDCTPFIPQFCQLIVLTARDLLGPEPLTVGSRGKLLRVHRIEPGEHHTGSYRGAMHGGIDGAHPNVSGGKRDKDGG